MTDKSIDQIATFKQSPSECFLKFTTNLMAKERQTIELFNKRAEINAKFFKLT